MMKLGRSQSGFTGTEMVFAVLIIAILAAIYFLMLDSYRDRRMSEQAAKVLMLSARAQEEFFAKEHRYFDAEVSGDSSDGFLVTADGHRTSVQIPYKVVVSFKSRGQDRAGFSGQAYYKGSDYLHKYDSETGKIVTVRRNRDETG